MTTHAAALLSVSHIFAVPSSQPSSTLPITLSSRTCGAPVQVELVSRAATLLVRLHHAQLVATVAARAPLLELRRQLRRRTQQLKDRMGFNLAALSHLQRSLKQQHEAAAM